MKHPATCIANYYRKNSLLDLQTIECMEYTVKAILNELSKVLIYSIIFGALQMLSLFFACYITFVSIRLFAGGIHCKSYWGCFLLSFLLIGGCIYWSQFAHTSLKILLILSLTSCMFPLLLSPVTPSFRIIKKAQQRKFLRILALATSLLWMLIAKVVTKDYHTAACILCTIIVANYQLIVPKVMSAIKR